MDNFDIPIFKKSYELYKLFYSYRNVISKTDRYSIWQRCDTLLLEVLENIMMAGQISKPSKLAILENASMKLNFLRVFIRLMYETKSIDSKKYIAIQEAIDEIGRMLGGWIKSLRQ
jgi:23S rRNA-intervening sequence protein